ncbi:MAG: TolC family protein [Chlamydiales bacterium]
MSSLWLNLKVSIFPGKSYLAAFSKLLTLRKKCQNRLAAEDNLLRIARYPTNKWLGFLSILVFCPLRSPLSRHFLRKVSKLGKGETVLFLVLLLVCSGCNYFVPNPPCPPPPSARRPTTQTYSCTNLTVPPILPDPNETLSLSDLVDLALTNSSETRAAWYLAKQAAADVGLARGAFLPPIYLEGFWIKEQFPEVDLGLEFLTRQDFIGAGVGTSYLLFDFGGRNGNLMSAVSALDSVNWIYNLSVQNVIINVVQTYYNYINAQAKVKADEATVEDNLTTVQAAVGLREAGIKDLSDELQARTNLVQSQIILEQDIGNLNVARSALLQSIGLSPDDSILVSRLPEKIAVDGICHDMSFILQIAKENRADLMAMRARVIERRFQIRTAESAFMPTITANLFGGKAAVNKLEYVNTYYAEFTANLPLFNSFSNINDLRKKEAELMAAQATLDNEELLAYLSVASDYYELIANRQILKYSYTYLEIAEKNRKMAFTNYKTGINTIIDLMTANNALYSARQQLINAKTNFLTSLANLAYSTGGLTCCDITMQQTVIPKLIQSGKKEEILSDENLDS